MTAQLSMMHPVACTVFGDGRWRYPWPVPPLTVLYTCWLRTCRSCETLKISFRTVSGMYSYFCPHLRLSLRTFSGLYSYFRIGGGPSMDQSGLSSCCAFFVTSYHPSSTAAFASGVFIVSGERSFLHVLMLRESDVSERLPDSSVREARFPEANSTK